MSNSRPGPPSPAPHRLPLDVHGLVAFARQLAMTPSVSGDEGAAIELTASRMGELGFERVEVDEVGNCVGTLGTGKPPRLLIDGHIDSIPLHSPELWTVDPFGAQVSGDRLYGLGACDQKSSIAAALFGIAAARDLLGELSGTVALVASVNEEDLEGAALRSAAERFDPTFAITSEPSDTRLCIGQRGRAKLTAAVTGRPCHAGHARLGVNSAEALAALITEVRALPQPSHPRLGRRDITCIDVGSSPYPSPCTVPGHASAHFDARLLPGDTAALLLHAIEDAARQAWADWEEEPALQVAVAEAEFTTWAGRHFRAPEFQPSWWTEESSLFVQIAKTALSGQGLDPTPTYYSFCTNGSYLAGEAGVPTIGFGVGEGPVAHQPNEYVTLGSLEKGAKGFGAITAALVGPQPALH
jgi:putative selenium metabolism hydrolase